MKRFKILSILLVLSLGLCLALTACGGGTSIGNDPEPEVTGDSHILVAYFSWSGNNQKLASWVAEKTGGELFRILPAEAYPADYNETADRAKNELDSETRPELSTHIDKEAFSGYDTIFLGFPVWWYDLPMCVWSFLGEYDFTGKTVIPFFSHAGSSSGANSLSRIAELIPTANYRQGDVFSVAGSSVDSAESKVENWLSELGYLK